MGDRVSKWTTNTSNNGESGGRVIRIIRCLLALEGALGGVGAPPSAVAALGRGLVDTGLVVRNRVGHDWDGGGGGGGDDGRRRHFVVVWLVERVNRK